MEDKTFELLTKMYSDFSKRFDNVENRIRKVESLIENDVKKDINALYDGYNQTYEKLVTVENKIDDISAKVDKQDVEIRVIKGGAANA